MNVQQVNATGRDISAFVIAAVALIGLTMISWFIAIQRQELTQWKANRRDFSRQQAKRWQGLCLSVRPTLFRWLLRNDHGRWALKTKAWKGLLTGDRLGKFKIYFDHQEYKSTCEYVNKHCKDKDGTKAFALPNESRLEKAPVTRLIA